MKLVKDSTNSSIMILGDDNRVLQVIKESEIADAAEVLREQKYRNRASKMGNAKLLQSYTEMVTVMALNQEDKYPDFSMMMDAVAGELFNRLSI